MQYEESDAQLERATQLIQLFRRDFQTFAEKCLKIQTKGMELIPFRFNRVQRVLWRMLLDDLKAGRPIRWMILKGRQMGLSTFIEAFIYWMISLRPNRNAIVAAHSDKSAKELFRKEQLFFREMPREFRPMAKINNRGHLYFANPDDKDDSPGLESQVIVEVSENVDMGRSFAIHIIHASEFAFWKDPKAVMVSIRNAMPKIPGTALFIETTGNGDNYFKELWDDEERDFRRVFICWVAEEAYRKEINPGDYFDPYDLNHEIYGNEVEESEAIRRELQTWYADEAKDSTWIEHEIMCRLAWRRECIVDECEKDLALFKREYPTVPLDAFLGTSKSVFDVYKLSEINGRLVKYPPVCKNLRFNATTNEFYDATYGKLRVFEPIYENAVYVIGADTSRGIKDGDPSAAVILRCPELTQAGVFSDVISPDDFAVLLYYLGIQFNKALIGVELNEYGGYAVNAILGGKQLVGEKRYYYPTLYRPDLNDKIHSRPQDKWGWVTNRVTKDIMITDLDNGIKEDIIKLSDAQTVGQLMSYQELPDGRLGCPRPKHDDLVTALAIAYQMASRAYYQTNHKRITSPPEGSVEWWARLGEAYDPLNESKWAVA